jgi:hypothetical protein
MENYCECCEYKTKLTANFKKHLESKKHKQIIQKLAEVSPKSTQKQPKVNIETTKSQHIDNIDNPNVFPCKYCEREFKFKQSMYRHIKYSCTKNKTEDLAELVRLLNLQLEQQKSELENKNKQLDTQSKQIDKLMSKLEINYTNNSNNTINVTNNITLLNYKDTDLSHITDVDYKKCITNPLYCVLNLIKKIHFNPQKPENMNMYIPTLKEKYIMMYEDNRWMFTNREKLKTIYENKEDLIEDWFNHNKDDKLKKYFNRYLNMKDEEMGYIMDELKLLLFNKRDIVKQQNYIT